MSPIALNFGDYSAICVMRGRWAGELFVCTVMHAGREHACRFNVIARLSEGVCMHKCCVSVAAFNRLRIRLRCFMGPQKQSCRVSVLVHWGKVMKTFAKEKCWYFIINVVKFIQSCDCLGKLILVSSSSFILFATRQYVITMGVLFTMYRTWWESHLLFQSLVRTTCFNRNLR
jgi:hypothetical protein